MSNEIVFVGAGPIGLWTAVQIKLQRPEVTIVFKEKKQVYSRTHTLFLEPASFNGCFKDETGVIQGIISQLQDIPHIRTNELEKKLRDLAISLRIPIEICDVQNVARDILSDNPDAAMIIGSDGVRSKLRTEIFGEDNAEKEPLAYAVQIKYFVKGDARRENKLLETYPLQKHSTFLSTTNVGRPQEGKTPVTIQFIVDKDTYENVRDKTTYAKPIRVLTDSINDLLPPELLKDVKTHLGFRISKGEDIIIDSINLTATELPQHRCKKVTKFENGRYYGLIGDAALGLSFFKGMNSGLQLATLFSKTIIANWDKIVDKDVTVFQDYEEQYKKFASEAFSSGHKTRKGLKVLSSAIHSGASSPFQVLYFNDNDIADFQRSFDVLHHACQFYIGGNFAENDGVFEASTHSVDAWLKGALEPELETLTRKLIGHAERQVLNAKLSSSLRDLATLDVKKLTLYDKANLNLAFSKTCTLLDDPTEENHQACVNFAAKLKTTRSSFSLILGSLLELIAGCAAMALGIFSIVSTAGAAIPVFVPLLVSGTLLSVHGIFRLHKNTVESSPVYKALDRVIKDGPALSDGSSLKNIVERDPRGGFDDSDPECKSDGHHEPAFG